MTRLAIYIFYDKDGIVDDYVIYYLQELKTVADRIIVVVNGDLNTAGYSKLSEYTSEIVVRENIGFEQKAYEHIFLNYLSKNELQEYDEVIMSNNSFYGPFAPFKDIFNSMESQKLDFWGMGMADMNAFIVMPSFFIVYRKKIIKNRELEVFFDKNKIYEVRNFGNVVQLFEYGLFSYLKNKGYSYGVYSTGNSFWRMIEPDVFLIEKKLPIIARKAFGPQLYENSRIRRCIDYIKNNTCYDVSLILKNAYRQYGYDINNVKDDFVDKKKLEDLKKLPAITCSDIESFFQNHNEVYIYGAGNFGGKIATYYSQYSSKIKGFVISDGQSFPYKDLFGYSVIQFSQLKKGVGVIVAMNKKLIDEVKPMLENDKSRDYLFFY